MAPSSPLPLRRGAGGGCQAKPDDVARTVERSAARGRRGPDEGPKANAERRPASRHGSSSFRLRGAGSGCPPPPSRARSARRSGPDGGESVIRSRRSERGTPPPDGVVRRPAFYGATGNDGSKRALPVQPAPDRDGRPQGRDRSRARFTTARCLLGQELRQVVPKYDVSKDRIIPSMCEGQKNFQSITTII